MQKKKIKELLQGEPQDNVTVFGWVRTLRDQKSFAFIEINDGSTFGNLQIVLDSQCPNFVYLIKELTTGASVRVIGKLIKSPGKNQALELRASEIEIIGPCNAEKYPLQKKRHSFEYLRTIAHLRPRTNTQGAVLRVRNALAFATHLFFQKKGFLYLQTPIITGSDCEGGGEMFRVTTLDHNKPEKDFFGKATFLTVSGQLEAEIAACALSDVYTFGPTFRAENSNTSRHLAEFWMIEPEMAFADLQDDIACAEEYVQFTVQYALENCKEDMAFFDQHIDKGVLTRLENILKEPFAKVPYTEAIEILKKASKNFEFPVGWGMDLQSEHERFLAEEHYQKPVVVTDYPKHIKAFYMRSNDDGKTVAAMDILVPKLGELIGGSQREERLDVLEEKIKECKLNRTDYWWYLELREYGTVPHAGFGLGFERLVQFVTGVENIRDAIPFPRYPSHCEF
ncbi:MAG: asparagine--tRNA ligase [Chlamydiae bacterium RIFCSPHIGHO2_02_FULL_45_9]|nr:MAG: asparagine--tRNA ligase [Chlamydiae bacterium RIFCSPHIGHO2_02_FULL_45_9]